MYQLKRIIAITLIIVLTSCQYMSEVDRARLDSQIIDSNAGLTREQFRDALLPKRNIPQFDQSALRSPMYQPEPNIPDISDIVAIEPETDQLLNNDKLISLSVTDDIPLKDVLIELSHMADVDMEIDPNIEGGIILRVKDKPFNDVIERIVDLGGLRYSVNSGIIRVEKDNPYKVDYQVDFLNIDRTTDSTIAIDTQGLGSGGGEGGGGELPSGSTNSTTLTTKNDVWSSLQQAVENMLTFEQKFGFATAQRGGFIAREPEATQPQVENLMQLNRQAGVLSVFANRRQHKNIEKYISLVEEQVSTQVLIEAKVVEVTLDEEFKSGIDWGTIGTRDIGFEVAANFGGGVNAGSSNFFTINATPNTGLSTVVNLTELFGTTRTISSPRLHAMNNQPAILSFAENSVYFELEVQEEVQQDVATTTNITNLTVDSQLRTVPVGVILSLQPSINKATNEITMHVRPTLSRITGTVSDPGVEIAVARQLQANPQNAVNIESNIPIIEVRELDSILKIKSGEIMVIGGLMQDEQSSEESGVPGINKTPIFGNLFKNKAKKVKTIETVIFIKATIIDNATSPVTPADQRYYNTFAPRDPRPLAF